MSESTITMKGQTTVPKSVRQLLGVGPGDRLRYVVLDNGQVRMMKTQRIAKLAGMLRRKGQGPVSLEDMEKAIADGGNRE